ncbi:hypothetical protein KORDIASMS9_00416 [Kordia sp. SMS9]|uniref:hypothetical protein n=1 Tax=Kordia sp. SMS9 TaxID=2282170 RepID=UPI000E0DE1F0|nr:hypothetical protein [Kordia sp. SMS9]AXG68224.1 hypothetical protein KORDIASMS9_00416 [Kordia sp. SMS9]
MIKKEQFKTMGKIELRRLLYGISRRDVREITNETIAKCRNISVEEAKKKKLVLAHEAMKVADYFGFEVVD